MKLAIIFFFIGIGLIILEWRQLAYIDNMWIVFSFILSFIFYYISTHLKNKEMYTPKPVYVTN